MNKEQYTAQDIVVLDNIEAVQTRPGMYVGDVDSAQGYHHLLWELLDNAVDEASEGHATHVSVTLCQDGSAIVEDNGRGIPVDQHPSNNKSAAEIVLTTLHAGGKFSQKNYKAAGGLHGVGAAVVNALSAYLDVEIYRNGYTWHLKFIKGRTNAPIHQGETTDKHGTRLHFIPNHDIMHYPEFDTDTVRQRMHLLSYLCPGIHFSLTDKEGQITTFFSESGTTDFIRHITQDKETIIDTPLHFTGQYQNLQWDIAWTWTRVRGQDIRGFTNTIPQPAGGHHVNGMLEGIWKGFRQWVQVAYEGKKIPNFYPEDIRDGLNAIVSIRIPEPKFSSQTKERLVSAQIHGPIEHSLAEEFAQWLEIHPEYAKEIFTHVQRAAMGREAGDRARNAVISDEKNISLDYGKLEDCIGRNPEINELYIIEGDSAAGSVKNARERQFQAVLPLRGKIRNIERLQDNPRAAFESKEINAITAALRCGVPGTPNFNIDNIRYHNVVIMTDADVDGSHIRCLLIAFFYRYYKPLIERGYLYIAQPPLYRLSQRKRDTFVRDEAALEHILMERGCQHTTINQLQGPSLQTYLQTWTQQPHIIDQVQKTTHAPETLIDSIIGHVPGKYTAKDIATHMDRIDDEHQWSIDEQHPNSHRVQRWAHGTAETYDIQTIEQQLTMLGSTRPTTPVTWDLHINDTQRPSYGPYSAIQHINNIGRNGCRITRYKGIGEMNPNTLWDTTLNPATRIFRQIHIQDAEDADRVICNLMGEDTQPRKDLLTSLNINTVNIDG